MSVDVRGLKKRSDFTGLKSHGKRVFRPAFVMQWQRVAVESGIAVGYTASTKAVGNAGCRNRARRRLKAAVDVTLRLNPAATGGSFEIALIAKQAVLVQPFEILVRDLRTAFGEIGIQVPDTGGEG